MAAAFHAFPTDCSPRAATDGSWQQCAKHQQHTMNVLALSCGGCPWTFRIAWPWSQVFSPVTQGSGPLTLTHSTVSRAGYSSKRQRSRDRANMRKKWDHCRAERSKTSYREESEELFQRSLLLSSEVLHRPSPQPVHRCGHQTAQGHCEVAVTDLHLLKNAPAELFETLMAHLASPRDPPWHSSRAPGGSSIPGTVLLAVEPAREFQINVELI